MNYEIIYTIGRSLFAATFILSGVSTLQHWQDTIGMMKAKHMPQPDILLALTVMLKLVAGTMLILHFHAAIAALGLLLFTALATVIFHNFWSATGMERRMHYFGFLSNLSMMGGLSLLIALD